MHLFSCKNLQNKPTSVNILKETRIKMGLSIGVIARHLVIAPKFIANLEEGKYNRLPGTIYIKNFIKKYADFLKLNTTEILSNFEKEQTGGFKKTATKHFVPVCKINNISLLLRKIIVASLALFLVIYLGAEVWGIYKAPPLELDTPLDGQVNLESSLAVKGTTKPEMKVQINGMETVSDSEGKFLENVTLNPGNNQIIVTVIKKHGRTQTILRNVIYREKKEDLTLK